jgi:hypothetical protein
MFAVFHAQSNHISVPLLASSSTPADVVALRVGANNINNPIFKSAVAHVYGTNPVTFQVCQFTEVTASVASSNVQFQAYTVVLALSARAISLSHTLNTTESTVPHTETV